MIKDEIIRPSKSTFNLPVIVVSKKGTNEDGTPKHRFQIDTPCRTRQLFYPSKYFSTIDLESGFHQILMKESDVEKT